MMSDRRLRDGPTQIADTMRLSSVPLRRVLAACGAAYFAAILLLVVSKAPLGSGIFFGAVVIAAGAYAVVIARIWHEPSAPRLNGK